MRPSRAPQSWVCSQIGAGGTRGHACAAHFPVTPVKAMQSSSRWEIAIMHRWEQDAAGTEKLQVSKNGRKREYRGFII